MYVFIKSMAICTYCCRPIIRLFQSIEKLQDLSEKFDTFTPKIKLIYTIYLNLKEIPYLIILISENRGLDMMTFC